MSSPLGFAVWAFWQTFLRWDKTQGTKVSIILIVVVFQTVLICELIVYCIIIVVFMNALF